MFSWLKSAQKGAWGAFPALPAFLLVRLLQAAGIEVTASEALELSAFVFAVVGFISSGVRNVRKNRRRTPAVILDPNP